MTQLFELAHEPELFLQGSADSSFLLYGQSFKTKTTTTTKTTMPSESVPAAKRSLEDESSGYHPSIQTSPTSMNYHDDTPETDAVTTELFNCLSTRRNIRQGREAIMMLHAYFVAPQPPPIKLLLEDDELPKQVNNTPAQQDNEAAGPTPPQSLFAKIEELESQGGGGGVVLWSSDNSDDENVDFDGSETDWSIVAENFGIRHRFVANTSSSSMLECTTQYSLALVAQQGASRTTTPICS